MKKRILIVLTLTSFMMATGQNTERDANYHFKSNSFAVALKLYKELQAKDTSNAIFNDRLGLCYLNTNQEPWKALKYLLLVEEINKSDASFMFELGKAYLYNYRFDETLTTFNNASVLAGKNQELMNKINLWIQYTQNAQNYYKKPLDVSFINLGKNINTEMDELTPVISPDGEMLFYTSNQKYDSKFMLYTHNVYMSNIDDGDFDKGRILSTVTTMDEEFVAGFSNANDKLFVQLQGYEAFQDLIFSERNGKAFKGNTLLNANVNSKSGEIAATETENGDTLYFSSNRPGGMGGLDIYYALKLPTGEWGVPRNCGANINSAFDEDFPTLSTDGSLLYFCSNGLNSMGGFDVFKSSIDATTREFKSPVNLGFPLNDVFDNKTVAFTPNQRYAYVSTRRPEGFGYTDLYRVVFNQEDPSVKILIISLKTGTPEAKNDFTKADSTLRITSYLKGKVVFGNYKYDVNSKQATLALPPGSYSIEIQGQLIEPYEFKIVIPDVPTGGKVERKEVFIKLKN
ncbi:MAG: hypothetical protein M0P66_02855 [Salinivirgaceae bacterium]|nr:hypothetical protein [Salinivirgaceae bacterium]